MKYNWNEKWLDLYKILEIPRKAKDKEIKKAYRILAKKYHPDKFANATAEEKAKAGEKIRDINLAYEVLSDKKEKEIYDAIYDARLNGTYKTGNNSNNTSTNTNASDINYDDVMKDYDEASKRTAERLSALEAIKEELEQSKLYLEKKNEFFLNAYIEGIDKNEFFLNVQELQQLAYDYINSLSELAVIAYDYDLLDIISAIDATKDFMIKEFEKLPMNEDELIMYVSKEMVKEKLKKDLRVLERDCEYFLTEMDQFASACFSSQILPIDFHSKKSELESRVKDKIDYIDKLKAICQEMELEKQVKDLSSLSSRLSCRMHILPVTHEEAIKQGKYLNGLNLSKHIQSSLEKVKRIITLLKRYPKTGLNEKLYQEALLLLKIILEEKTKLEKYAKDSQFNRGYFMTRITELSEEAKKIYKEANLLNAKIEDFYQDNTLDFECLLFNFRLCAKKVPASDKCLAIDLESQAAELFRFLEFSLQEDELKIVDEEQIENLRNLLEESIKISRDLRKKSRYTNKVDNRIDYDLLIENYYEKILELQNKIEQILGYLKINLGVNINNFVLFLLLHSSSDSSERFLGKLCFFLFLFGTGLSCKLGFDWYETHNMLDNCEEALQRLLKKKDEQNKTF